MSLLENYYMGQHWRNLDICKKCVGPPPKAYWARQQIVTLGNRILNKVLK